MPSDSLDTAPAILADTIGSEQQMPAVAHSKRQLRSLLSAWYDGSGNVQGASTMQAVLASTNRAKLIATQAVIMRVFPDSSVRSVAVAVEVPAQPIGDEQTQAGAIARARAAVSSTSADFGIGMEGGLRQTYGGWALCSWAAVVDARGTVGVGGGGILLLPPHVVERVLAGEELSPVMDELAQATETRHGLGASGILTGGLIDRGHIFEDALICALVPWLHPAFESTLSR